MSNIKWTAIEDILTGSHVEESVHIRGWIYRTRSSGNIVFMTLRDVSGILQATVKRGNLPDAEFEDALKALIESSIQITGTIKEDKRAPGGYEVQVTNLTVINFAEPFPITKDQSPEFLLDQRHLWIRSRKLTSILKIRSTVVGAIHSFFRQRGFYEFDAPIQQLNRILQLFRRQMRVPLSHGQCFVTQKFLQGPNMQSLHGQMTGIGVS